MIGKFYAIKDEKSISTGTIISTIFAILSQVDVIFSEDSEDCSTVPRFTIKRAERSFMTVLYRICFPCFRICL